jgi:hypothetical protein
MVSRVILVSRVKRVVLEYKVRPVLKAIRVIQENRELEE